MPDNTFAEQKAGTHSVPSNSSQQYLDVQPSFDPSSLNQQSKRSATKKENVVHADSSLPTAGQLMRNITQNVQRVYRQQLGHSPQKITCNLLAGTKLCIWIEESVTSAEKLLYETDKAQLDQLRLVIDKALGSQIIDIVEAIAEVEVVTCLSDTCYEQNCTFCMVLLTESPRVRCNKANK